MPPKKHKHCGSLTRGESRPRGGRTSVQKVLDLLAQLGGVSARSETRSPSSARAVPASRASASGTTTFSWSASRSAARCRSEPGSPATLITSGPSSSRGNRSRVASDLDAKAVARAGEGLKRLACDLAIAILAGQDGQLEQPVRERHVGVQRPERPIAQADTRGGTVEERVLVAKAIDRRVGDRRRVREDGRIDRARGRRQRAEDARLIAEKGTGSPLPSRSASSSACATIPSASRSSRRVSSERSAYRRARSSSV